MLNYPAPLSFQQMLQDCTDPSSPNWEHAWLEFSKRYKKFLYANVKRCCLNWNSPHMRKQLSEVVNDIVEIIFEKMCVENHKVLRGFAGGENEQIFHAWLATICYRTSSKYLRQKWYKVVIDQEASEEHESGVTHNPEIVGEMYEAVVKILRTLPKRKTDLSERDITIFLLYTFAGFSDSMLRSSVCLKELGHRVVDVVVHRLRKGLGPYRKLF